MVLDLLLCEIKTTYKTTNLTLKWSVCIVAIFFPRTYIHFFKIDNSRVLFCSSVMLWLLIHRSNKLSAIVSLKVMTRTKRQKKEVRELLI